MKLPPAAAGTFYPGNAKALEKMLASFTSAPVPALPGKPVGFLLPHAGYVYSGEVAAIGYRSLPKAPATVVVVGPSHSVPFAGTAVFKGEAVETPIGEIPVDMETAQILLDSHESLIEFAPAYAREHSVEVHFPLIKKFLPGASVVPLITGQGGMKTATPLASALAKAARSRDLLVVASSDLSHYPEYDVAVKADGEFLKAVLTGEPDEVLEADRRLMGKGWEEYHCTHCGHETLLALLGYAKLIGAGKRTMLKYRNSGDVTGDRGQVVGYAAVAFCL
jgi:AmmeMemoRadiSam system protein B